MHNILLYVLIIMLGFIFKKNKIISLIMIVFVAYMIIISKGNADYHFYELNYEKLKEGYNDNFEIGFQILNLIFIKMGLTYFQLYFALTMGSILLIFYIIFKNTQNPNFIFSLYLIFPFIVDLVQYRNLISMSIIIFSSIRLFKQKKVVSFIIGVIISTLIHKSSIIYLILLFPYFFNIKVTFIFAIISFLLLYFFNYQIAYLLSPIIDIEKLIYFESDTSLITKIGILVYFIIFNVTFFKMIKYDNNINGFRSVKMVGINFIMIIFIALLLKNLNFSRLFRNTFILTYVCIPNIIKKNKGRTYINIYSISYILIIMLATLWWVILAHSAEFNPYRVFWGF